MRKATLNDKAVIIEMLTGAFDDNQSVNYIIKQDSRRQKRISALMDYSYEICSLFGDVWLSDDGNACALVLYPQNKRSSLKATFLDLKLIVQAIGLSGIKRTLGRENKIKTKQPKHPMAYLWFIGVNVSHQHKGIGSKLLRQIIADASAKDLPVFLETSTTSNLPWYEHFGFKIYDQLTLTYTLYFLRNN